MHLKEIILDGFKSYPRRTKITGFDRHFNAITGSNGSGKSNILDAICFVLGISDVSVLRARLLTDLIYKSGTAGIVTATVSLVFDNTEEYNCPSQYKDIDEITIARQINANGKTKYTINNVNIKQNRVIDLFCEINLDIRNPHFMVLQGQITKVLNMKPKEVLGMIENAMGISVYDSKREEVPKLIARKDVTLDGISSSLRNELGPAIDRLKEQRGDYAELRQIEQTIATLERRETILLYQSGRIEIESLTKEQAKLDELLKNYEAEEQILSDELSKHSKATDTLDNTNAGRIQDLMDKITEADNCLREVYKNRAQIKSDIVVLRLEAKDHEVAIDQLEQQLGEALDEIRDNQKSCCELENKVNQNSAEDIQRKIDGIRRQTGGKCPDDIVIDEESGEAMSRNQLILKLKELEGENELTVRNMELRLDKAKMEHQLVCTHVSTESRERADAIRQELNNLNMEIVGLTEGANVNIASLLPEFR